MIYVASRVSSKTPGSRYRAYGLTIASELALHELITLDGAALAPDTTILLGRLPEAGTGVHPTYARRIGPFLWGTEKEFWFSMSGVARSHIVCGSTITVDPDPAGDADGVRTFLLGTALGIVLAQRGYLMLHGNAIRVGGGCVVCVGPPGAGKSTLAAGFVRRGHALLADDLVMVDESLHVTAGVPRIKLWADMTRAMAIDSSPLRRIRPNLEKLSYPVFEGFAEDPVPVHASHTLCRGALQERRSQRLLELVGMMIAAFPV